MSEPFGREKISAASASPSPGQVLLQVLRGFCMGSADIVPGVSGGTIALVLGIYERLVACVKQGSDALGALLAGRPGLFVERLRRVEWAFLLPLLAGIGLAVVSLAKLIEHLLETRPEEMAGAFAGLVAGSAVVAWRSVGRIEPKLVATCIAVAAAAFWLLGLRSGTTDEHVLQVSDPEIWAYGTAGALAICAMILPGVSGSFLLVTIGMYGPVLSAVNDRDFVSLGVFSIGCVAGLAAFSQLLHWALARHHDVVMAGLVGLMLGSLRVLWPWPAGVESTVLGAPGDDLAMVAALAAAGLLLVVALTRVAEKKSAPDGTDS